MRYKTVHSIESAERKIKELQEKIETAEYLIESIKEDEYLADYDFGSLNRRIGQFKRHINFFRAEIKLMEKINKLAGEKVY